MKNTDTIYARYTARAEDCYIGIMRAQADCGTTLGNIFVQNKGFVRDEFMSALTIGMKSLDHFSQIMLCATNSCERSDESQTVRDFALYIQQEVVPHLCALIEKTQGCDTKEQGSEVLASYLEMLGDERMQHYVQELEYFFL
jgi:hypothetical protein